ncbi:hypothetical protein ACFL6C_03685 [Myxococcota bacterium]
MMSGIVDATPPDVDGLQENAIPRFVICVLLSVAACNDPQVRVIFDIPAAYEADVDSLVLHILQPSETSPFSCDDLVFGAIDDETIRAHLLPDTEVPRRKKVPLPDIDRDGLKLFWGEGLDQDGKLVVADCEPLGEVDEDLLVELEGEPATVVSLGTDEFLRYAAGLERFLPLRLQVRVVDTHESGLVETEVRWMAQGPNGQSYTSDPMFTDSVGRVEINLEDNVYHFPPGPYRIEISVPWHRDEPPTIESFKRPAGPDSLRTPGVLMDAKGGRVGPGGEPGMVAMLAGCETGGDCLAISNYHPASQQMVQAMSVNPMSFQDASLAIVPGEPRDRILIVTAEGDWQEVRFPPGPPYENLILEAVPPPFGCVRHTHPTGDRWVLLGGA